MTTTNLNEGSSIVEGVDNDVLLAFIALAILTISTMIYFRSLNGSLTSTLGESWQYFRTRLTSVSANGLNDQSPNGIVQENEGNVRDAHESRDSHLNEQTSPSIEEESIPLRETFQESNQQTVTEEGQKMARSNNLPGTNQAENVERESVGNRTGARTESLQSTNTGYSESQFSIRIKHHEVERSFIVEPNMTVGELKRLTFPEEVGQGRRVRFIYSGRLLSDESASISFYGIYSYSVVHAQLSDVPQQSDSVGQDDEEIELDMSRLFIPVLTLILCGCWYGLMNYRQLFDVTSTAVLVIVTGAYAFLVYAMFY